MATARREIRDHAELAARRLYGSLGLRYRDVAAASLRSV